MQRLLKTLFGKITLIFLGLLLILAVIQMYLSLTCTFDYYAQKRQTLNAGTAQKLANALQPYLEKNLKSSKIDTIVKNALLLNPGAHVYLLDSTGTILANYPEHPSLSGSRIRLEPIRRFLRHPQTELLPLTGDDPLQKNRQSIFSASPIRLGEQPGYLFITFDGAPEKISMPVILGNAVIRNTAMLAVLSTLFSFLAGLILFFFLTRRIKEMRTIVHRFEKGHYDERVPVTSNDEVGELAQTFNHMAGTFERYVTQLEENDRLRRELIANISHDLRSPLSSIQGYVETILIKDSKLKPDERKRFLEISLKNIIHLNDLVRELFDLAKFDAKQIAPQTEPFSIAELAQDIVLKFEPQAKARGMRLLTRFSKHLPMVVGDIGMIERAISNLIQNAINYGKETGEIVLQLEQENNAMRIVVSDDGQGIPEEDLPHIFERFYRVDKSRTRNVNSSGLGLAIVKKIINAHGRQIFVESSPGKGTTFYFTLPIWQKTTVAENSGQTLAKL